MLILILVHFVSLPVLTSRVRGDTMEEKTQPFISSRVVRTKYGDIRGFIVTPESRFLEPVEVFRGVPYASPPVGSLRFMPPVSGAQWSGVKIAEEFSPVCPQVLPDIRNETAVLKRISKGRLEYLKRILPFLTNQSEDCLYLNIYAPAQGNYNIILCYIITKLKKWLDVVNFYAKTTEQISTKFDTDIDYLYWCKTSSKASYR
ncbi:unnamed protein product [Colias eurytheme]|nr:unnamed protein product [Colias eurytheme]